MLDKVMVIITQVKLLSQSLDNGNKWFDIKLIKHYEVPETELVSSTGAIWRSSTQDSFLWKNEKHIVFALGYALGQQNVNGILLQPTPNKTSFKAHRLSTVKPTTVAQRVCTYQCREQSGSQGKGATELQGAILFFTQIFMPVKLLIN